MTEQGYSRCHSDHCVYFKRLNNGRYIILLLYVDYMLVAGSDMRDINVFKRKLAKIIFDEGFGCYKTNPWYENSKRQETSEIDIVSK